MYGNHAPSAFTVSCRVNVYSKPILGEPVNHKGIFTLTLCARTPPNKQSKTETSKIYRTTGFIVFSLFMNIASFHVCITTLYIFIPSHDRNFNHGVRIDFDNDSLTM